MTLRTPIGRRVFFPFALAFLAILALSLICLESQLHAAVMPAAITDGASGATLGIDRIRLFLVGLVLIAFLYFLGVLFYVLPTIPHRSDSSLRSGPPFKQQPLLNKGEGRFLAVLDRVVPEIWGPTARVCPQVSYGEFLSCAKFSKFARMNSRRADFVVITADHRVALVVELQGSGHFGSTAKSTLKARYADLTKRCALNEADIPLLEVGRAASETSVTE